MSLCFWQSTIRTRPIRASSRREGQFESQSSDVEKAVIFSWQMQHKRAKTHDTVCNDEHANKWFKVPQVRTYTKHSLVNFTTVRHDWGLQHIATLALLCSWSKAHERMRRFWWRCKVVYAHLTHWMSLTKKSLSSFVDLSSQAFLGSKSRGPMHVRTQPKKFKVSPLAG